MTAADNLSVPVPGGTGRIPNLRSCLLVLLLSGVLYVCSHWNYLVFHVIVEGWSVFVALGIFVLGACPARFSHQGAYSRFIGVVYLLVGAFDFLHMLTYRGMGIIPDLSIDTPTQLWLVARLLQAVGLVALPLIASGAWSAAYCGQGIVILAGLLGATILPPDCFPACFIEGSGLTPFKIGAEAAICGLFLVAGVLIWRRRPVLGAEVSVDMLASVLWMLVSEVFFSLYTDVSGVSNVCGHVTKALAFYYVFRALVFRNIEAPIRRRIEAEREAVRREQQIRVLIEGTRQALWEWQPQADILRLDDNWPTVFGVMSSTFGNTMREVFGHVHPADAGTLRAEAGRHFEGQTPFFSCQFRLPGSEGTWQWYLSRGMVVERDSHGVPLRVVGICEDITERHRAEEEMHLLRDELAHATRVNTMGQLAASIAHELNQPLAAIRANAQAGLRFLHSGKPDMNEIIEIFEDVIHDNRRAGDVISGMRAMLQKQPTKDTAIDMNAILRDMVGILHSDFAAKHVSAMLMLQSPLPFVNGDRVQLQQVLLNLMMNAVDAMTVTEIPASRRRLTVGTLINGEGAVETYVQDQGIGMDDAQMAQIFRPFFTTKGQGLGMGLVISRRIVESHGGNLRADRNPDGGMTFRFSLPTASSPNSETAAGTV